MNEQSVTAAHGRCKIGRAAGLKGHAQDSITQRDGLSLYDPKASLATRRCGMWELPVGRGSHFLGKANHVLNPIVGGWTVNTIATFSQGDPFTVLAANSTSMDPMTSFRPDRLCNGRSSLRNRDVRSNGNYWFDTSCFQTPGPNMFGNSGANILTGPGVNNWDFGLGKLIPLHELVNLEFRAEAFNAFNHAQFLNPDFTMTDASFGRITTAAPARELQFAMKVLW